MVDLKMNCPDNETFELAIKLHNKLRYLTGGNEDDQDLVALLDCLIQDQRINIAQTLEKLQGLNPELYGNWYTKLYHPVDVDSWNVETLHTLEQLLISETL